MCFLSEAIRGMAQWPNDKVSPFTETIVAATVCGRALEHKQRQLMLQQLDLQHQGQSPDAALDFGRRHRSLAALSVQHTKVLSMRVVSTLEHPDPLLIFAAMTAYTAVLTLGDTVASKSVGIESPTMQTIDTLLIESTQQSLSAVHELGGLIASLAHQNHFQVSHWALFLFILFPVIMCHGRKEHTQARIITFDLFWHTDASFHFHPAVIGWEVLPRPQGLE